MGLRPPRTPHNSTSRSKRLCDGAERITHFAREAQGYAVHNGESLFVRHAYLAGAGEPFETRLRIPGVLLLLVLGIFPLVVAIGLLQRRPWSWFGAFAVGCGLIIFELVEYEVIGYNVQQPIWDSIGALIALVSLAPSVQRSCGLRWGRRD